MTTTPYGPALWAHHFPEPRPPLGDPAGEDLFGLLAAATRDAAERPHITFEGRSWTYRETHDLALRLAAGLLARGVGLGDRVGLCLPNTPAYIVLCFALWRLGAVGVGMNTLYSAQHLRQQAGDADLKLLFAAAGDAALGKVRAAAEVAGCEVLLCDPAGGDLGGDGETDLSRLLSAPPLGHEHPGPQAHDIAMLQYTGGTTGAPKGAMLSHRALRTAAIAGLSCMPRIRRGEDVWHSPAPLSHISGLINYACIVTAAAGENLLVARFSTSELLDQLRRGRPTILTAIPTMLTALVQAPDTSGARWDRVKHVLAGGAATPLELWRAFKALSGLSVQQAYGMTETAGAAACMPPGDIPEGGTATGAPMPGLHVEIRDLADPLRPMPVGETGEICIGGEHLMDAYWGSDDPREPFTPDGLLRSGDVGVISADGYLHVVDRLKDVVICSGYNVYPRVIDEAVLQHPAVAEAIAVGVPDSYRGETILVAAALRPGERLSLDQLQEFLADKLSPIEMPKRLVILDQLPKSENGKLSRQLIRSTLAPAS